MKAIIPGNVSFNIMKGFGVELIANLLASKIEALGKHKAEIKVKGN